MVCTPEPYFSKRVRAPVVLNGLSVFNLKIRAPITAADRRSARESESLVPINRRGVSEVEKREEERR